MRDPGQAVYLRCDAANERSANVARRCGFVYEGTHRSHLELDGRLTDTMFFARVPGDRGKSGRNLANGLFSFGVESLLEPHPDQRLVG